MNLYKKIQFVLASLFFVCCSDFLNSDLNDSEISHSDLFDNDKNSVGAVTGIYRSMVASAFAGGGADGIPVLCGLYSDELHNFMLDPTYTRFEGCDILATDLKVQQWWSDAYRIIYQANDAIEGLNSSNGITDRTRNQLKGESLFVRAFCYFYLLNIFGDVPVTVSSDFRDNSRISRMSVEKVYEEIIIDLQMAFELVADEYQDSERVRPNKATIASLLARVYLYLGDWDRAIEYSSIVIEDEQYVLNPDLTKVFLKDSPETVWQLASEYPFNTSDGANFVIMYGPMSSSAVLSSSLFDAFSEGDERFVSWVGTYEDPSGTLYFPFKYKVADYGLPVEEHYIVFRLAEQYLIRSEARAASGDLEGAISDVDQVRARAKLPLVIDSMPDVSQSGLLSIIQRERQVELFCEGGHRWFDLRRTGQASPVLSGIKNEWSENDRLFPIPQKERETNPRLGDQNPGY